MLRYPDFRRFLIAAAVSNAGTWMQLVALQALLFRLTDSGSWLGLLTVITLVPAMVCSPYAGVLADRVRRQNLLRVTQSVQMIAAFALWFMYNADIITPWWIVAISAVNGLATGFQTASWQSFIPSLVPPDRLVDAIKINSIQYTIARLVGPTVGAAALHFGGVGAAFFGNGASYLYVIAVLFIIKPRSNATVGSQLGALGVFVDGARYVWRHPALRLAVALALCSSMFGQSLQYLASAVSERVYAAGSEGNAGLLVAFGLGAMVSSTVMLVMGGRWRRSWQTTGGFATMAVAVALFPMTDRYLIGQVAYFLLGVAQVQIAVSLNTVLQQSVPDEYRGRVLSFYLIGILGGIPAGSQLLGSLGDRIGFRAVLAMDAAAIALVVAWLLASGGWRSLDPVADQPLADASVGETTRR